VSIDDYTTYKRLGKIIFMRVPQGVAHAIAIFIYKADTPNVLPLATVRWTSVIVTVVLCQTL